jgi:hypothetical protein
MRDDWWPWLLRILWVSLPFTLGPAHGDALASADRGVQLTGTIASWSLWVLGLTLTLVPHWVTLTPVRILAPGSLATALLAATEVGTSASTVTALAVTAATASVAMAPQIGAFFVNGSSYGDELRLPLRPPAALLLGPIPLAWAIVTATLVATPLLLADGRWVAGIVVGTVGGFLSYVSVRSLHRLARRWLVFVPAGIVLHDLLAMADPVLVKRSAIERLGPALADTTATDLSMAALGLALEVRLSSVVEIAIRPSPNKAPELLEIEAVVFSPSRPGSVLDEAERRRIRVG